MDPKDYDFGGYATKNDLKCSDGRVIRQGAFDALDGQEVPLVYHHIHDDLSNVLGHALLEVRPDGVYCWGRFNETPKGKLAKEIVQHGDVKSLSIYANQLKQRGSDVIHGVIREVSIVLAGANPGASIDNVSFQHGDDFVSSDEDVIMNFRIPPEIGLSHKDNEDEDEETFTLTHQDTGTNNKGASNMDNTGGSDKTIKEIFDSMTDEQKQVVYIMVGAAVQDAEGGSDQDMGQDGFSGDYMKNNIFDMGGEYDDGSEALSHEDIDAVFSDMTRYGSLKESMLQHGITNVEVLFPEAQTVTPTPAMITRPMEWVDSVLNGVRKTPFSRIKSTGANLTADEARARGYVKGAQKIDQVITALKRTTTPQTIYKKQSLDRDDVIDIKDFDVVSFIKDEMRVMLNEELARAVLIGDGRDVASADKISPLNIRPIWQDDALYSVSHALTITTATTDKDKALAFIDDVIAQRKNYHGSGQPTLYIGTDLLTACRLLKDGNGYRLYKTDQELADDLRVSSIVEVGIMDGKSRTADSKTYNLAGIVVNLKDYSIGADKGGEVNTFDDFDIDFNKMKYLIETRASGALTLPQSALVFEFQVTTA